MMRKFTILLLTLLLQHTTAQPSPVAPKSLPALFPGLHRLSLVWTNATAQAIDTSIKGQLFQTSSELALLLPNHIEGTLRLLPHQAAFVPVSVDAPAVQAKTRFLIAWEDATQNLGKTEFEVYPRDILRELQTIAGEQSAGLVTTNETFQQAFLKAAVQYRLINKDEMQTYDGKLLIVDDDSILKQTVLAAARRGVTVVTVTSNDGEILTPSFSLTPCGRGVAIFVQRQFLENFDTNPESQLRLVKLCRMAKISAHKDFPALSKEHYEK